MAGVRSYSITPANNATVDGTSYFPEGQAPSSVNDAARLVMRDQAELWELESGTLQTGGSANAQTLTPTRVWGAYTHGDRLTVKIGAGLTNTGSATLNVSGLGAKTLYRRDGATTLNAGELAAGSVYSLQYDSGINGFRVLSGGVTLDEATAIGSDVASASTVDLDSASGGIVTITGTTTITAVTLAAGRLRIVRFSGALTLTHGSSLVLPGAANIQTAAGDWAIFVGDASSVVRCIHYQRIASEPLAFATQAQMETATSNVVAVTPGRVNYNPGVAKAWVVFDASSGTPTITVSHNVTSITDNGAGDYTVNFTTAFSSANYGFALTAGNETDDVALALGPTAAPSTSAFRFITVSNALAKTDFKRVSATFYGDQ